MLCGWMQALCGSLHSAPWEKMAVTIRFLVVSIFISYVHSQGLGPDNCLISRIDTVPCSFNNRATQPGVNEFGIYVTRYRDGQGGFPFCRILARDEIIRPIRTIGSLNQVFVFYSPGFTLDQQYGESQFVDYKIQCGGDRVAFFNITDIDMEARTCNDSGVMRCVDYVVLDGDFGNTESCGSETSPSNVNQFIPGDVRVIFRTNVDKVFRGFEANVICVNREDGDMEGCTRPEGTNMTAMNMTESSPGRRKRDLEDFHKQWQRRAAYIRRMRRQAVMFGDKDDMRIEEISVVHGMNVTYRNRKLEFIDVARNITIPDQTIENIIILMTFDANGDTDVFKGEAVDKDTGLIIPLPGPGPLFIVGRYAYFQLFIIDPRGLVPTPEEMIVLANLTEAQVEFAREDESERLTTDFLDQPTFNPEEIGLLPLELVGRKRRQATEEPPRSFPDQAVMVALENENACNPVLRASALSIIETLMETEAGQMQLERLRAELLAATATPSVETEVPGV